MLVVAILSRCQSREQQGHDVKLKLKPVYYLMHDITHCFKDRATIFTAIHKAVVQFPFTPGTFHEGRDVSFYEI